MIHYCIKKVGDWSVPQKPYLIKSGDGGYLWGRLSGAIKFIDLKEAKHFYDMLIRGDQKVFIEWHDDSKNPKYGKFGEVNPIALEN